MPLTAAAKLAVSVLRTQPGVHTDLHVAVIEWLPDASMGQDTLTAWARLHAHAPDSPEARADLARVLAALGAS